jgi:hypothetical protein
MRFPFRFSERRISRILELKREINPAKKINPTNEKTMVKTVPPGERGWTSRKPMVVRTSTVMYRLSKRFQPSIQE